MQKGSEASLKAYSLQLWDVLQYQLCKKFAKLSIKVCSQRWDMQEESSKGEKTLVKTRSNFLQERLLGCKFDIRLNAYY